LERSEFKGKVYDVGPRALKFSYSSKPGRPVSYRPFYALILGHLPDVLHYLAELDRLLGTANMHVLIFSRHPMTQPLSFSSGRMIGLTGAVATSRFLGFTDDSVEAFELRSGQPLHLTWHAEFREILGVPLISPEKSEIQVRAVYWQLGKFMDSSAALEAIHAVITNVSGTTANLAIDIDPSQLAFDGSIRL
jgi:hypothetical protein